MWSSSGGTLMGTIIVFLFFYLFAVSRMLVAVDTIEANQSIRDGETIVSAGKLFEMGFFSPIRSPSRFLGIWFKRVGNGTVVWVANRDTPINGTSGVLTLSNQGILVLVDSRTGSTMWSSNSSRSARNPVAQLLETGNLVLKDSGNNGTVKDSDFIWQSFDYPGDTLLIGMKLGIDIVTGLDRYLTSWKSEDDPARTPFTYGCDPRGYPQFIIKNGMANMYRLPAWNGVGFSGLPLLRTDALYRYDYVFNEKEVYYKIEFLNSSGVGRFVLNPNGVSEGWLWADRTNDWVEVLIAAPIEQCSNYGLCGAYGSCNTANYPVCTCLDKFVPKNPNEWSNFDWSNGCVREKPLDCQKGDGFLKYSRIPLPDTRNSSFDRSMTLQECKSQCLKNCSCMAYSSLDVRQGGSGCLLWFDDLIDFRFTETGQDIFVRIASSELTFKGKKKVTILISLAVSIGMLLLGLGLIMFCRRKKGSMRYNIEHGDTKERQKEDTQLPLFDFSRVMRATNKFAMDNKLGQGGFGSVYKGVLEEGQEIAVKRLSTDSRQGLDEFKNEVLFIAKLQHRNLVKLLGYCIQGEEKILIYEYMPNTSLDYIIFDETRNTTLDWPKRFEIIKGIARGLLYLHQDSRLRVIHRDLKASNILLDNELNPKISDFGMARSFGGNETEANTSRVVGTYGYMSPEYAIHGVFSVKSDVFSFGVLVLEIVTGKRNRGFSHPDHSLDLPGHMWKLYKEDKLLELTDTPAEDSSFLPEKLRSLHVGLLCVQQSREDRPNMSSVVLMLGSNGELPQPKKPGFFSESCRNEAGTSSNSDRPGSVNEITYTTLDAR